MKITRRTCLRTLMCFLLILLFSVSALVGWFFFYRRDLPRVETLQRFVSTDTGETQTIDSCGKRSHIEVLRAEDMGLVRQGVIAAEGDLDKRSFQRRIYEGLTSDSSRNYGFYSMQLARELFCSPDRTIKCAFAEWRTSIQIEENFNPDQVLTIYLNRAYFGDEIYGVQNAAKYYFGKDCRELRPSEAALLAGLIRRPSYLSPTKHPDRALLRRNEVLNQMVKRGSLTTGESEVAKASPLGTRNP